MAEISLCWLDAYDQRHFQLMLDGKWEKIPIWSIKLLSTFGLGSMLANCDYNMQLTL